MMHVIPHLEHGIGTFLPEGGCVPFPCIWRSSVRARRDLPHGTPAARILHAEGRVTGVEDAQGQVHRADWVVSNADLHPTYRKLLPDVKAPERI